MCFFFFFLEELNYRMLRMESFKHNIRLGFFKDSIPFFLVFGNIKKRKKEKKKE